MIRRKRANSLFHLAYRVANGTRKIAAGLRPFNESVWPGVRNDLFVAHESLYTFFATRVEHADVLDAGCGTGYGTAIMAAARARSVTGVDIDQYSIRYARRRYDRSNVAFYVDDIERLTLNARFDVIVASNAVEHLHDPREFLRRIRLLLKPSGAIYLAIPPIYSAADVAIHKNIHYHRNQLYVAEWIELFDDLQFQQQYFAHRIRDGAGTVDFTSLSPSALSPSAFVVTPVTRDEMLHQPSITAIFQLTLR